MLLIKLWMLFYNGLCILNPDISFFLKPPFFCKTMLNFYNRLCPISVPLIFIGGVFCNLARFHLCEQCLIRKPLLAVNLYDCFPKSRIIRLCLFLKLRKTTVCFFFLFL